MKQTIVTIALLAFSSPVMFGGLCVPGSVLDYYNLGATGCSVGAADLTNFTPASGIPGATAIDPALVQVTPGGTDFNPFLLFTLNSSASSGDLQQLFFRFTATGPLGGAGILLGSPQATGDGAVTGILDLCADGTFAGSDPVNCSGSPTSAIAFAVAGDQELAAQTNPPFSSFFDVFVDLTVDGGLSGSASLESATVTLSAIPEPSSWILLGGGLAALFGGALLRRVNLNALRSDS